MDAHTHTHSWSRCGRRVESDAERQRFKGDLEFFPYLELLKRVFLSSLDVLEMPQLVDSSSGGGRGVESGKAGCCHSDRAVRPPTADCSAHTASQVGGRASTPILLP